MIVIPAIFEGYRSLKDRTLKLTFETGEPTPQQVAGLTTSLQKPIYLAIKENPFKEDEIEALKALKADLEEGGKTDSQRLRGALYVWWTKDNQGYEDFEMFKKHYMNKFIEHVKTKIEEYE
jgi:hypothetical protein